MSCGEHTNTTCTPVNASVGDCGKKKNAPPASPHLADDAVLHVGLLVASLLTHQCDLQLAERFGQDVTLCKKLSPLHNVGLQQGRVILVTEHPLRKSVTQYRVS